MVTGNHLGNTAFAVNKWEEAIEGYTIARSMKDYTNKSIAYTSLAIKTEI